MLPRFITLRLRFSPRYPAARSRARAWAPRPAATFPAWKPPCSADAGLRGRLAAVRHRPDRV